EARASNKRVQRRWPVLRLAAPASPAAARRPLDPPDATRSLPTRDAVSGRHLRYGPRRRVACGGRGEQRCVAARGGDGDVEEAVRVERHGRAVGGDRERVRTY